MSQVRSEMMHLNRLTSMTITIKSLKFSRISSTRLVKEHFLNKILRILKTKLDLKSSSPPLNRDASCRDAKQLSQNTLRGLNFVLLAFLQRASLSNVGLEHSGPTSFSNRPHYITL